MALYQLKKEEFLIEPPKLISGEELERMRMKESLWRQGLLEEGEHDALWDRWVFDLDRHQKELERMPKEWRQKSTRDFFKTMKEDMN
jgi:hypothetical protein